ncbi:hypothetical protein HMPREF9378_0513 [Streptococcus sanguinis SK1 = NCTC 7863]|uniref:Uncharacterized protein n=2 Tax=Streptococcus sanguinis TaxID=1305 RepID=F0IV91_STRSA|nr:hypothetical protein HMPREF9384_1753 [Streptococcus sanguinis SK160]EGF08874.1 hypothetical protein HMPREF9378_0513 [Streptococcus sanguinis SK1 = NCTC 7863]EGF19814.1 hypothetical protein HMPREF9391_0534 [Streptococcus sanguinis SK408]EGF21581.1 hypothetical protein HMPREF9395_1108 [Streptococcus sanguinis SK1058]
MSCPSILNLDEGRIQQFVFFQEILQQSANDFVKVQFDFQKYLTVFLISLSLEC